MPGGWGDVHYGQKPGFKVYTHLSDRYGPSYSKLIAATASEALHVLDALLYHQSEVALRHHHTDGGGDSDHVFALCALLGFQFAPRIPGLKHRCRDPLSYGDSVLQQCPSSGVQARLLRCDSDGRISPFRKSCLVERPEAAHSPRGSQAIITKPVGECAPPGQACPSVPGSGPHQQ
jgi:hypothetical protein